MEPLIEHCRGVPLRRQAAWRLVADSDSGERAEFCLDDAAAFLDLWRLADIGRRRLRSRRDGGKLALGEPNAFVRIDVSDNQQDGIRGRIICLKEFLDV